MKVSCPGCDHTYTIEDNLLLSDKNLILTCKKCKCRIKIDVKDKQKRKDSKIDVGLKKEADLKDGNPETEQSADDLKNQILKGIKNLPPMPHVVIKAQQLMVDPHSSAKQVAGVIESDQAIAAKVLKMANSAYYGMSGKVSSLQHATIVLGYQTLGEIITTASFNGFLGGKLPGYGYQSKALWKHSLSVAISSKMIAEKKNHNLVNEAYTAGLIHDVGKVVLDNHILAKKDQINQYMEREEKTFFDAERHFFGFDHAEIASEICQKWNIPDKI